MSESDAIWAETTDGGLLHQLFGYYPTLHDAVVDSIAFDRSAGTLTMEVDYEDEVSEGEKELNVRMRLVWSGLVEAEISSYDTYLDDVSFLREEDLLRTRLGGGFGLVGTILSEGFEAKLDKVDPPEHGSDERRLKIRYV